MASKKLRFEVVQYSDDPKLDGVTAEVEVTITPAHRNGVRPQRMRGLTLNDIERELRERLDSVVMEAAGSGPEKYGDWEMQFVGEVK